LIEISGKEKPDKDSSEGLQVEINGSLLIIAKLCSIKHHRYSLA
jgi:hypothetical protein